MKDQLKERLASLEQEYSSGQKMLNELKSKQANLETTMLRIDGAIQVLKEEIEKSASCSKEGSCDKDAKTQESAEENSPSSSEG